MVTKNKIIGILGGMGPESTALFYEYIIKYTPIKREQDHIPLIIFSNPAIPDRTSSILLNKDREIIKKLLDSSRVLINAGATKIIIICNTSHYYLSKLKEKLNIPFISLIEETKKELLKKNIKKALLLATTGTIKTEIYKNSFKESGIELNYPNEEDQEQLMQVITNVKIKNYSQNNLKIIKEIIKKNNSRFVILGCTELSVLLKNEEKGWLFDPLKIIANKIANKVIQ